jgi:ERCC4-type nuclease
MIITDDREPDEIHNLLAKYQQKRLPLGDYIVNDTVIIERKTASDFVNSLVTKHLKSQVYRLTKAYANPVLAIIGNIYIEAQERISRQALIAQLASLTARYNLEGARGKVSLITFETDYDFALYLNYLDKKTIDSKPFTNPEIEDLDKSDIEAVKNAMLGLVPNLGEVLVKNLLRKFGSIRNIANATVKELTEVDGLGLKKAKVVFKVFSLGKGLDKNQKTLGGL